MSEHGRVVVRRIVREYRKVLVPLAVLLVVNVLAFVAIVMPLAERVANIEQREDEAQADLAEARREHAQATGTLTGKDKAARELDTFYNSVLPQGLSAARDLWGERVPDLAEQLGVMFESRSTPVPDPPREDEQLVRLTSEVGLAGRYNDLRAFVHRLETSPEFVIIDTIELEEGEEEGGVLEVTLYLSTYYRAPRLVSGRRPR